MVHNDTNFYVKCVEDAKFQDIRKVEWPKCVEPKVSKTHCLLRMSFDGFDKKHW